MGAVTSQEPYVTSEQISALLGSTHPTVTQNQKYLNKNTSIFKTMTKKSSLVKKKKHGIYKRVV